MSKVNKKSNNKKKTKFSGFTLIELLAVIVILGILMIIAIPSVTRVIEQSRKKAVVTTVNELVGAVRYGVISEDSEYAIGESGERTFALKDIPLEKGDTSNLEGYVKVIKTSTGYEYKVKVNGSTIDSKNYCSAEVNIDDLGNSLEKCPPVPTYNAYMIGDKITFAGSNWYVIQDSTKDEDYVTVLKEKVLTYDELGSYAYKSHTSTMKYHRISNVFDRSLVKEMFDNRYITMIGENNLKEVNNYKIRLITKEELVTKFGYVSNRKTANTPAWIYSGFGEGVDGVHTYWTMSPDPSYSNYVWYVNKAGWISAYGVNYPDMEYSVRPVINLLKSAIE